MSPTQDQPECPQHDQRRLIYVVEDDQRLLEFIAASLAAGPWLIKTFDDPEPALRSFVTENPKPALLLTDYSMRSMDGLELGKRCRALHGGLKVVLISGTAESEVAEQADIPLEGFVSKPFQARGLFSLVQSILMD